jgi:hypothetical protein
MRHKQFEDQGIYDRVAINVPIFCNVSYYNYALVLLVAYDYGTVLVITIV